MRGESQSDTSEQHNAGQSVVYLSDKWGKKTQTNPNTKLIINEGTQVPVNVIYEQSLQPQAQSESKRQAL